MAGREEGRQLGDVACSYSLSCRLKRLLTGFMTFALCPHRPSRGQGEGRAQRVQQLQAVRPATTRAAAVG